MLFRSLFNLILTILGLVGAVVLFVTMFARKEEEDEERYERDDRQRSGFLWRIFAMMISIVSLVVFIITEDMRNPMTIFDKWSLLMVVLFVIELAFVVVMMYVRRREEDNEDAYSANDMRH